MASVRSYKKIPPCLIGPTLASSKVDQLLAKAEHISDGGRTLAIIYLRRGEICCTTAIAAGGKSESI